MTNKLDSPTAHKAREIIVEKLGVEKREVVWKASFSSDLGADSLDLVELAMEFEKEFEISIPEEHAESLDTVGKVIEYLLVCLY